MARDDADILRRRIFGVVKPTCVAISKRAMVSNQAFQPRSEQLADDLEKLAHQLDALTADEKECCDANVGDYIFFPLNHLLTKDQLGDRATEYLLDILAFILKYCWNLSLDSVRAQNLYMVICYLYNVPSSKKNSSVEVKLSSCRALDSLFGAIVSSHTDSSQFINPTTLGQITLMLMDATGNDSTDLQLASLQCTQTLFCQVVKSPDALAPMVPGVTSRLVKLTNGSSGIKCHFTVVAKSLDLLSDVVCLTCKDTDFSDGLAQRHRTPAWLKATSQQLSVAFGTLIKLRNHYKQDVVASLLHLSINLVQFCRESLKDCIPVLVDNIVFLAAKGNLDASDAMKDLVVQSQELNEQLHNTAYDWILSLPRVVSTHDESQPVQAFNIIRESLTVLDVTENSYLFVAFVKGLSESITFDNQALIPSSSTELAPPMQFLAQQQAATPTLEISLGGQPPLRDLGIVSPFSTTTERALTRLLSELGRGNLGLQIADTFLQSAEQNMGNSLCVSQFWMGLCVLRQTIISDSGLPDLSLASTVDNFLRLSSQFLQDTRAKDSIALRCLALEGLSLAALYKKTEFRIDLIDHLYLVLELLADPSAIVVKQAQRTTYHFAQCSMYSDVRDLVVSNADYLVDAISIRLNMLDISPRTPVLLEVLLQLAGPQVVPFMDDLVETMFILIEEYQGYDELSYGVFNVFNALVSQVSFKYLPEIKLAIESGKYDTMAHRPPKLLHFTSLEEAQDYLSRKPDFSDILEEPSTDQHDDSEAAEENTKTEQDEDKWVSPVPKSSYTVVKHIVEHADRYMTHNEPGFINVLLQLVENCVPIMASQTEEFLPLVHQIWPALVFHLNEENVTAVERTLACIASLCQYAKEFMTSRVSDLWPQISRLLPPRASLGPKFSRAQRIFDALVPTVVAILDYCPLPPQMFDTMLLEFSPYLSESPNLRNAFERINADAVWLELLRCSGTSPNLTTPRCTVAGRDFYPVAIARRKSLKAQLI